MIIIIRPKENQKRKKGIIVVQGKGMSIITLS